MTMTAVRRLIVALALLVVGPGFLLGPAPAAGAATCASSGGVSVVVDYRELGGAITTACVADGGGKSAAVIFEAAGVALRDATRQPGFVCQVNAQPAGAPCVNASPPDAFWGLWWSSATQGSWTFSSSGVGGLIVPAGGSVGWSWQEDRPTGGAVPPGVAPPVNPASPSPTATSTPTSSPSATPTGGTGGSGGSSSPTASPTPGGGNGGSGGKGGKGGSGSTSSPSATPSGSPSGSPSSSPSASASASPSASPSESPLASESPGDSERGKGGNDRSDNPSEEPSVGSESPGDSSPSAGSEPSDQASESPGDSRASGAPDDQPGRVPAAVTWSVVALLAIAIGASALVARRRRGA